LSSLFPEFYDRALEQLVLARKTARITQAALAETLERRSRSSRNMRVANVGSTPQNSSESPKRSARTRSKC
jgi:hypothetical protein